MLDRKTIEKDEALTTGFTMRRFNTVIIVVLMQKAPTYRCGGSEF